MMNLIESIRNNDIIDLHLCDAMDELCAVGKMTGSSRRSASTSIFSEFLAALERNTSIESIHLEKDFMGDLRHDCRERLLYALGRIRSLKDLTLADALLQIRHISSLIEDAKSLQYLRLHNIVLQGVQSDFDAAEEIIHGHDCSMTHLEMVDCIAANSSVSSWQGLSKDPSHTRQKMVTKSSFGEGDMIAAK